MKSTVTKPTWKELAPGIYPAVFNGREGPKQGQHGMFIVWNFEIPVEGGLEPVNGLSSTAFVASRRCKGFRWAQAIDPTLSEDSTEWNDEAFQGVRVQVAVEYQNPDEPGFLKVKEVYPFLSQPSGPK